MTDRFEYKCIHIAHKTFLKPRCQGGWSPRCPRTLSTAPPVPGGGRQGKAPAVQRLSLMGNTQPRDRGGMWPWARGQRDRDGSSRELPRGGAAQAVTRPGEQPAEEQAVWAGRETAPSNTGWGVSLGSFFTGLLLASWERISQHPLSFAYSPLGRGITGLGRDWAPLGASV